MYTTIYLYRIKRSNVEAFLDIQRRAAVVYREYGALEDATFVPVDLSSKYGCLGFEDVLDFVDDEVLLLGSSRFTDKAHHDEVMARVDEDQRIDDLFEQVKDVLELSRLVRGEFREES